MLINALKVALLVFISIKITISNEQIMAMFENMQPFAVVNQQMKNQVSKIIACSICEKACQIYKEAQAFFAQLAELFNDRIEQIQTAFNQLCIETNANASDVADLKDAINSHNMQLN